MGFNYVNFATVRAYLAARLSDPNNYRWLDVENGLYITEALRTFQALTALWVTDYVFTVDSSSSEWLSLNTLGSPRIYTLTDSYLYTLIQYHLLEPATGSGTWTGTTQFDLSDLTQAFERRHDELIQFTACNVQQILPAIPLTAGIRRIVLPDTILEVRRARFLPNLIYQIQTLWREDPAAFQYSSPYFLQTTNQVPRNYSIIGQPPLTLDVDYRPPVTGALDLLAMVAGLSPAPPASTPLAIPDDWSWVLKWGMLGDLLNMESEAQDSARAQYCMARFIEGIGLMQQLPWISTARVNDVPLPLGIDNVNEKDAADVGWEINPFARPAIVVGGIDLIAISPSVFTGYGSTGYGGGGFGGGGYGGLGGGSSTISISLQVMQNAPVPVLDSDPVQVSRDQLDTILDYAVHLAMFKNGGAEFQSSLVLFDNFRKAVAAENTRLADMGKFEDVMKRFGQGQEAAEGRYRVSEEVSS